MVVRKRASFLIDVVYLYLKIWEQQFTRIELFATLWPSFPFSVVFLMLEIIFCSKYDSQNITINISRSCQKNICENTEKTDNEKFN